jgi:aminoglycoside/choline kinase family phosphotransferase
MCLPTGRLGTAALEPEEKRKALLEALLERLKVQYLVAGHMVRPKFDLVPRFDNHVFLIDTGMLKEVYGGRASALEFRDGTVTAYYTDGEPQVLVAPGGGATAPASSHDNTGGRPKS